MLRSTNTACRIFVIRKSTALGPSLFAYGVELFEGMH